MKDTAKKLQEIIQKTPIRHVPLPEGETVHSLFAKEGSNGLSKRISQGESVEFEVDSNLNSNQPQLTQLFEHKLLFQTPSFAFHILGSISQDLGNLTVTLMAEDANTGRKERTKLDLYASTAVRKFAEQLAEKSGTNSEVIEAGLLQLTDALEGYRDKQIQEFSPALTNKRKYFPVAPQREMDCISFLKEENLIKKIDKYIQQSGVVGEEQTRTLLFVIAMTYKMNDPLHCLIQASSGSGKSHLINAIGALMPHEDVISITRVSSKSLYHYSNDELVDKVVLIQDFDGLNEEAQYAFRELQSAGSISSSTTIKDKNGNLRAEIKTVRGHFASLSASTKEIYTDNAGRSIVIGIDESTEQTKRIINYQNQKLAGIIDTDTEFQAKTFLQDCVRTFKPFEVVNPYADKIELPVEAKMLRRLNSHFQSTVKAITILNQFQREKDPQGRLIAQPEDLKTAFELLFPVLILKVDDLDPSLRQFFNSLKNYIQTPTVHFTKLEIRQALHLSKTQCFRYMEDLEKLEYIQKIGGHANKGFKYKISFWDDEEKIKEKIRKDLNNQLAILSSNRGFGPLDSASL